MNLTQLSALKRWPNIWVWRDFACSQESEVCRHICWVQLTSTVFLVCDLNTSIVPSLLIKTPPCLPPPTPASFYHSSLFFLLSQVTNCWAMRYCWFSLNRQSKTDSKDFSLCVRFCEFSSVFACTKALYVFLMSRNSPCISFLISSSQTF